MASDEPPVEGAEGARHLHELALPQGERLAAHDPRRGDPTTQREHEDEVAEARAVGLQLFREVFALKIAIWDVTFPLPHVGH